MDSGITGLSHDIRQGYETRKHTRGHRRSEQRVCSSPSGMFSKTTRNRNKTLGCSVVNAWSATDGSVRESVREQWASYIETTSKERSPCLVLFGLKLDPMAIDYFMQQWAALQRDGKRSIKMEKIVLSKYCSFVDERSVYHMIRFMEMIGDELKELVVSNPLNFFSPFVHCLHKLHHLERLCFSRNHLAFNFQEIFENPTCKISELSLTECTFDDDMYHGFLLGLRCHPGLHRLEIGLLLGDDEFNALSDSIINSPSKQTLVAFDLSWNLISWFSFPALARILDECSRLEELVIRMCRGMLQGLEPDNINYRIFTESLGRNTVLKSVDLSGCRITKEQAGPLFQALEKNTTLERLDVWSLYTVSEPLAQSLPNIRSLKRLRARLDLQCSVFRKALWKNESLVCIEPVRGQLEVDEAVTKILYRNEILQKAQKFLQNRNNVCRISWAFYAEQLMKDCLDMSPLYAFVSISSEIIQEI